MAVTRNQPGADPVETRCCSLGVRLGFTMGSLWVRYGLLGLARLLASAFGARKPCGLTRGFLQLINVRPLAYNAAAFLECEQQQLPMPKKETMTPRERVNKALNHEIPDRVPIDLGGNQTGIHKNAYRSLIKHLGIADEIQHHGRGPAAWPSPASRCCSGSTWIRATSPPGRRRVGRAASSRPSATGAIGRI